MEALSTLNSSSEDQRSYEIPNPSLYKRSPRFLERYIFLQTAVGFNQSATALPLLMEEHFAQTSLQI